MQNISQERLSEFVMTVWQNYTEHGRSFPWRETSNPYEIMVSEFMLQQTQTARVMQKYEAWLQRFPTVQSVAGANLSEALSLWNGLGYNRRAKFLYESCQKICIEHSGTLPHDAEILECLPGIGQYTARAIATFAFNQVHVFIETNIRSAFIHFFFPHASSVSDVEILPLVERTLDITRPRAWYYALMDYGAELKRVMKNPSRKSTSYTQQAAFKGSLRQARGAILRQLSQNKTTSLAEIASVEHIDMERLKHAMQKLIEEKLIREEDGRIVFG